MKDNGVVGKSDRAEVEALVAKYAKDVLDEVDVRKFEAWQKAGYLDPTGIPNFSLSSRDPEYMKVWKWHMQVWPTRLHLLLFLFIYISILPTEGRWKIGVAKRQVRLDRQWASRLLHLSDHLGSRLQHILAGGATQQKPLDIQGGKSSTIDRQ